MNDTVLVTIIGGVVSIVLAVLSSSTLIWIKKLERQINSRMDQLIETIRKAAHAEGVKESEDKNDGPRPRLQRTKHRPK